MYQTKRGSALLSALIFGAILLFALAAFIGTAMSEFRGSTRSAMNTAAFCLAEAGVDRAAALAYTDSFSTTAGWTATSTSTFARTFTADSASLGALSGSYKVVVQKATVSATVSTFTIYSKGSVTNSGAGITAERAVKVTFTRATTGSTGNGAGCLSLSSFLGCSSADANISASQVGPTFDSYVSSNNTAPNYVSNRFSNCLVGTNSAANDALNLGNGQYFCKVGTGSSTATPTPTVKYAKDATTQEILATMLNFSTTPSTLVTYNSSFLRRDVAVSVPSVVPPVAETSSGWTLVLPSSGTANSQWALNGKLTDYNNGNSNAVANVSYSGSTLTLGTSNTDKIYATTASLDNVSKINVSGTVVLVVTGALNAANGLTVNYTSADAKLTVYCASSLNGVLTSTQQINASAAVPNWEASRLTIYMTPGFGPSTSDTPGTIAAKVTSAITTATTTSAGKIDMNFDDTKVFVGSIVAPYSFASLSATGNKRYSSANPNGKMSDYCGALIAGELSVLGSNGFAFHFDEQLGGSSSTSPTLTLGQWQQILPTAAVFK
ncbi:MAG: hypothetical protein QM691_09800 [Opitutaceae bacterium]